MMMKEAMSTKNEELMEDLEIEEYNEARHKLEEGIFVGGELVKDVRFADDQGMLASTEGGLQEMMDSLTKVAEKYDMKINVKKTKVMKITRQGGGHMNITINGQKVEQVSKFKYL